MFDTIIHNHIQDKGNGRDTAKAVIAMFRIYKKLLVMAKAKKNQEELNAIQAENGSIIDEIANDITVLLDEVASGQVTDETLERARAQNAKLKEIAALYTPTPVTNEPDPGTGTGEGEDTGGGESEGGEGEDTGTVTDPELDENGNPIAQP